ncbi:HEPN domain-containing protein [Rhodococcus gordoniae]|nr:HEPN domain-containing protein [Rhodococcus gordoniae]
MAFEKFPDPTSESIGQFQVVDSNGKGQSPQRTGVLRFSDNRVTLEVSPGFTPTVRWSQQPSGGWVGSNNDSEPARFAVLGSLAVNPSAVTLWGVRTTRRRSIGFAMPDEEAPGNHEMRMDWCLVGDHIPDETQRFGEIRVEATNLHDWAGIPTTTHTIPSSGRGPRGFSVELPDAPQAVLINPPGQVRLVSSATISPPAFDGFKVSTNTAAVFNIDDGLVLTDALSQVATPIASLMTMLSGAESSVRRLGLIEGDISVNVLGYQVDAAAPKSAGELFLYRGDVDNDFLSRWLDLSPRVSPVPQILAAAWSGEFATVDTEALTLATAAEMLHRRLYPNAVRFSDAQIEQAVEALRDSMVEEPVKESLLNALGTWWADQSYPQRLRGIAEPVAEAVPSAVGKIGRWRNAVHAQRVAGAHGLGENEAGRNPDILDVHALNQSLRWVLTFRLLLETGVTPEQLAAVAGRSRRYEADSRQWKYQLPDIFG